MKKIIFLIITTLFFLGCNKEEGNETNLMSINLITNNNPIFFVKTVILFENNEYLIKTNFDTYTNSYPFNVLYGYDEIKLLVTQDSTIKNVLLMKDYLRHYSDSTYILAFHLANGSCLIFDKKRNTIISKIEMENYMEGGPMTSTGGRRFYINGELFLNVVDLIS
ncbi:MAG: hypothetical protein ACOYOT_11845 [Bacteroidales bacterium]